jgi:hypothetical protein
MVQTELQSPGGVAARLTDLNHITVSQTTVLSRLLDQLNHAEAKEKLLLDHISCPKAAQDCIAATQDCTAATQDPTPAVQKALLECLSKQDSALCKLKTITAAQTTLLEDCFLAINAILGWGIMFWKRMI